TADGFEPATVMIKAGASVAWVNIDSNPHQIASDPHPTHSSFPDLYAPEPLGTNDVYSMIFEKAGTYTYHDNLNPYTFKGVVIVE
ncbi:hypothetical protein EXS66_02515, partial [Candidatus Saccharibacteria bacterium]|nr:hypothetical protein [Candidatus Saccharibacteria bacterium]